MKVLLFTAPENADSISGEETYLVNPTPTQMVALLRRRAEYWGTDSGDGSLQWCKPTESTSGNASFEILETHPSLSIIFHEGLGFHFGLSTGRRAGFLVPMASSTPKERILHYLGGNQAFFPAATFVSLTKAERIVKDFMKTGKPSPVVEWASGAKLRCGDPDS